MFFFFLKATLVETTDMNEANSSYIPIKTNIQDTWSRDPLVSVATTRMGKFLAVGGRIEPADAMNVLFTNLLQGRRSLFLVAKAANLRSC